MLSSALLSPLGQTKIYLYARPADMRKSFDGLHAIVQSEFRRDIRAGDVFVFLNRRLDRIKLIHWDRDGMAIWMKRLERGTFQRPRCPPDAAQVEIDATDLALLLSGIELTSVKRRPRYAQVRSSRRTWSRSAHERGRADHLVQTTCGIIRICTDMLLCFLPIVVSSIP